MWYIISNSYSSISASALYRYMAKLKKKDNSDEDFDKFITPAKVKLGMLHSIQVAIISNEYCSKS